MQSYNNKYYDDEEDEDPVEKYERLMNQRDEATKKKWIKEQEQLKKRLKLKDVHDWTFNLAEIKNNNTTQNTLKYIGGCNLAFCKDYSDYGVSSLIVVDLNMNILYEKYKIVTLTEPYIPSFLAFREVKHIEDLLNEMKKNKPEFYPQVVLCASNGVLHTRKFGMACHLGVEMDIPTIGISKNTFSVDGITEKYVFDEIKKNNLKRYDSLMLSGISGFLYGYVLISTNTREPIFVSQGNKVSAETALNIVKFCLKGDRMPEPIKFADQYSRKIARYINGLDGDDWDKFNLDSFLKNRMGQLHSTYNLKK